MADHGLARLDAESLLWGQGHAMLSGPPLAPLFLTTLKSLVFNPAFEDLSIYRGSGTYGRPAVPFSIQELRHMTSGISGMHLLRPEGIPLEQLGVFLNKLDSFLFATSVRPRVANRTSVGTVLGWELLLAERTPTLLDGSAKAWCVLPEQLQMLTWVVDAISDHLLKGLREMVRTRTTAFSHLVLSDEELDNIVGDFGQSRIEPPIF